MGTQNIAKRVLLNSGEFSRRSWHAADAEAADFEARNDGRTVGIKLVRVVDQHTLRYGFIEQYLPAAGSRVKLSISAI